MRSSLISTHLLAACLLNVGMYASAASLSPPPHQAQTVPLQRQAHNDLDRQGTPSPVVHRGNAAVVQYSALVRSGVQSHKPSGSRTIDMQPPEPGNQQAGNRQLQGPVGLLLALALVDGGGATRHQTPRTEIH
jgi:hypothetical protein